MRFLQSLAHPACLAPNVLHAFTPRTALILLILCGAPLVSPAHAAGPEDNFPPAGQFPPNWAVTPGANAGWIVAADDANGGTFSLKSGAMPDDPTAPSISRRTASIQAGGTFIGGTVTFAYRVSSEAQADFFQFWIDGAMVLKVSGAVPWTTVSFPVAAGNHVFRWVYDKDASFSDPVDAAWIDTVQLPVGTLHPLLSVTRSGPGVGTVMSNPAGISCGIGCYGHFPVNSSITLTAAAAPGNVFSGWSDACSGNTPACAVSLTAAKNAVATYSPADDAFPLGGVFPVAAGWTTPAGSSAAWKVSPDSTYRGPFSLKSGAVSDGQWTGVQFTAAVADGAVDFAYRVSSEAQYDLLTFSVDGVTRFTASGDTGWAKASVAVTAGTHTFRFAYAKDASGGEGSDAAWIDSVVLPAPIATQRINVTSLGVGAGSVVSNSAGIDCRVTCSGVFATNSLVTLTATPSPGSVLTIWGGACSGTATTCQLTMNATKNVTVMFWVPGVPGMLDIDGSAPATIYDAGTDGVLVLRYLFGMTGSMLTTGAVAPAATRTDSPAMIAYLDGIRGSLDVDGNGQVDPLSDGLLILRYMFGLRGAALTANVVGAGATRPAAAQIEGYIKSLMP